MSERPLIDARAVKKYFPITGFLGTKTNRVIKAVDDVTFHIDRGETFGLVGESGCGKSTLGRSITRMYELTDGQVLFDGDDISTLGKAKLRPYHRRMQVIFQDPYSALSPFLNVFEIIAEPLRLHTSLGPAELRDRVDELLERVGMSPSDREKFAYEFSGGQRQRIGIARALSVEPEFVLCDEPISALDVSIQAQVVNMLDDLQDEMGLSYLFVAHDLSMVRHISDRIGVMYLGSMVEIATSDELYTNPLHPYTRALLSAIPIADPDKAARSSRQIIAGDLPSPMSVPSGCRFHPRCPLAMPQCKEVVPVFGDAGGGHMVACHLHEASPVATPAAADEALTPVVDPAAPTGEPLASPDIIVDQ